MAKKRKKVSLKSFNMKSRLGVIKVRNIVRYSLGEGNYIYSFKYKNPKSKKFYSSSTYGTSIRAVKTNIKRMI